MNYVYTVAMNKGGVGKTSLITNIATVLAEKYGKKVLIIDMDGQGNSSMAFGLNPLQFQHTIYDVLLGNSSPESAIVSIASNLDIIPANDDMNFLEIDVLPKISEYRKPFELLRNAIQSIREDYDFIFIDTPPSIGLVTGNALVAADKVIVPFAPETFATKGLVKVLETIEDFRKRDNPGLEVKAVVGMMVDGRTLLHGQLMKTVKEYCDSKGIKLAETQIPRSIRFANSTAYDGKPATWGQTRNPIVSSYYELIGEVFEYGTFPIQ